jgi:hypothetical protein
VSHLAHCVISNPDALISFKTQNQTKPVWGLLGEVSADDWLTAAVVIVGGWVVRA